MTIAHDAPALKLPGRDNSDRVVALPNFGPWPQSLVFFAARRSIDWAGRGALRWMGAMFSIKCNKGEAPPTDAERCKAEPAAAGGGGRQAGGGQPLGGGGGRIPTAGPLLQRAGASKEEVCTPFPPPETTHGFPWPFCGRWMRWTGGPARDWARLTDFDTTASGRPCTL